MVNNQKKTKRVSARLTPAAAQMLEELSARFETDISQQIVEAVRERYNRIIASQRCAWEVMEQNGFIGCARGPKDLSIEYKSILTSSLKSKYDHS